MVKKCIQSHNSNIPSLIQCNFCEDAGDAQGSSRRMMIGRMVHAPLTEKVTRDTISLLLDDILEDFDDCLDLGDEDPIDTILKLTSQ